MIRLLLSKLLSFFSPKIVLFLFLIVASLFVLFSASRATSNKFILLHETWRGYKYYFIDTDGRVKRPQTQDTVSEGQAYAMLRAVWMNDKKTFDLCYRWTEENLSRFKKHGDHLLAWHWQDGQVSDWMPASDADIDYALSLIFAHARWPGTALVGLENYDVKAKSILADVLRKETFQTPSGRYYLSPWIVDDNTKGLWPINPSYFSPAHFRIFYKVTQDPVWLSLAQTTYVLLNDLSKEFGGQKGVGLIPDWCQVDAKDRFFPLDGKSRDFGWEAVRVPLRIGLDAEWNKDQQAREYLAAEFGQFLKSEWHKHKVIYSEYAYNGEAKNPFESSLFYSAYFFALKDADPHLAKICLKRNQQFIRKSSLGWFYNSVDDYYSNSLAWWGDGLFLGIIKDLTE